MQSGAEEEWDDEDWDDMDDSESSLSFVTDMSLATKMKIMLATALIILILICSMVFNNFGLYSGVKDITVFIEVEEALNPDDRTLNAYVLATPPTFGMLAKEGTYSILVSGSETSSGSFKLNDDGRGSIDLDYADFLTVNGDYKIKVEIGGKSDSDTVGLQKIAHNVRGEVSTFDGDHPLDKDDRVLINLQFTSDISPDYISPWVSGTVTVYHAEEVFEEGKGESYWNDDGSRNFESVEEITFSVEGGSVNWQYQSGSTDTGVNLWLETSEFYSDGGSGDYAMVIDFTNDFGTDTSEKSGQTFWKWFHICEVKNSECDGNK